MVGAMIMYNVRLTAQPGQRDALLEELRKLARAASDSEPGTLLFLFNTVDDKPDLVVTYEVFDGEAALSAHQTGPLLIEMMPRIQPLIAAADTWRGTPAFGKGLDFS